MQQEYFERYLLHIRELSTKSVENYKQALKKIDSVLQSYGFKEYGSIYDIDSYAELRTQTSHLNDPETISIETIVK